MIKPGWSIVYIEGSQVIIYIIIFLSMKIHVGFAIINSEDSEVMLQCATFPLGLHCLPRYPFMVFFILQRVKIDNIGVTAIKMIFVTFSPWAKKCFSL